MRVIFLLIIYFFTLPAAFGQSGDEDGETSGIAVLARAQEKQILLRWAPKSALAWEQLNKYGYRLERYTIVRDSIVLEEPEKLVLSSSGGIRPQPLHTWEAMVDENDYAAIAAQAIYGETFELDMKNNSDVMQIVNKVKETEARFSYALFAADQSFEVAIQAGLAFVDVSARKNEKYLYRVYSNVPEEIEIIDFGFVYIGLMDYKPLPKPYGLQADFTDKMVTLQWERLNFDHIYNSYWVEKSSDGGNSYSRISANPLINTFNDEDTETRYMYKVDSVSETGKTYYYRVRGVTSFGEVSMPSDSVFGFAIKKIEYVPAITGTKVIDNEKVEVNWGFPIEGKDQIDGFKIEKSKDVNGPFQQVGTFSGSTMETIDEKPYSTNYYRVKAFNQTGSETTSFPVLVQLQDSIPPAIPVQLTGRVDSVGIVTVSWESNTETDLLGYRVYRSNFKNSEFGQITTEPVTEPFFTDSISINTLTSAIYYKVMAVDLRFNPSDLSEPLALKKPDIIPPVPPVITKVKSEENGVTLQWVRSSSEDVASHHIYRKAPDIEEWILIKSFHDSTNVFVDNTLETTDLHQYTIIAVDQSNLESRPSTPVSGKLLDTGVRSKIDDISVEVDRESKFIKIKWEYVHKELQKYVIYRAKADEPISLYKTIAPDSFGFRDLELEINTTYTYMVKAVYKDGGESPFSEKIQVNF